MGLIDVLLILLFAGVGLWLLDRIPAVDPTIKTIIRVVVILVVLLWLIRVFVGDIPIPRLR